MDVAKLESLLEGAEESDTLEFKQAMSWDRNSLVRDILALSNTVDGGHIIIGIEDETLVRQGLNEDQVASFNIETMRDGVRKYADPLVEFRCDIVEDSDGRSFAVIEVNTFSELPVICARGGDDVNEGDIYFRSRRGRPQSSRVSSSSDMREIIENSISRRYRSLRRVGLVPADPPEYDYDAELGDL